MGRHSSGRLREIDLSTKRQDLLTLIRYYKDATEALEIEMHEVAKFAISRGWQVPPPETAEQVLAKQLSDVARREMRNDEKTGRPYRAYHSIPEDDGSGQLHLWIDIDEAPRPRMLKSLVLRRNQMVNDGYQLSLDMDHWNSIHATEDPIDLPLDLTEDVEWRKNAPPDDQI